MCFTLLLFQTEHTNNFPATKSISTWRFGQDSRSVLSYLRSWYIQIKSKKEPRKKKKKKSWKKRKKRKLLLFFFASVPLHEKNMLKHETLV